MWFHRGGGGLGEGGGERLCGGEGTRWEGVEREGSSGEGRGVVERGEKGRGTLGARRPCFTT